MARAAEIDRRTAETDIHLTLSLDGDGQGQRDTGVGFFDHMLDLLARHGRFDLTVQARGDLQTGAHHTVEDVGICLGQALDRALGDRCGHPPLRPGDGPDGREPGVVRRRHLRPRAAGLLVAAPPGAIGNFDHELTEEFFRALAANAKLTLHLTVEAGTNAHHVIEATFKACARALRGAVALDPTENGVPSTKGTLT